MAGGEVGSVYITVRAITDKVSADIEKAFAGVNTGSISASGANVAKAFNDSVSKGVNKNAFMKIGDALSNFGGEADSAREKLFELTRTGYITGTALTSLLGAVSSLIGGLGGLVGVVGGAAPALMGLVGAFVAVKAGMAVAQLAFEGISGAVQKAISQNQAYGMTVAQLHKQMQDLAFAAEDAANAETRAGLNLEKARNNLMRMQDLPPNSLVRREAMQSYKEAETAYRQAKARAKDARTEAANPKAFKTPKADPYAGLTPSQKAFAKFLVESKTKLDELKEAAAKGFLPVLQRNMETLYTTVFPTLKKGISDIATGLGGLTTNLTNVIKDPTNVALLGQVMKNIGDNLPIMGNIMGNIYSGMLTVLKASDPLVKRFLNFLNTKTKSLSDWLKAKDATGELQDFFDKAGNIMDKLWKIFEQAMGGLGAIIGANFEPGSGGWIMLDWLDKVTKKWDDLDSTVAGKNKLKKYFQDTATNSTKILDAVGSLVDQFLILGANPNIGKTFDAMNNPEAVKAVGVIAKNLADAGPSLGTLIANITIFISKLTDSKAITNFFDTINNAVKAMIAFVSDPKVANFLTIMGQIHGYVFGLIALSKLAGFGFKYMGEMATSVKDGVKGISDGLKFAKTAAGELSSGFGSIQKLNFQNIKGAFDVSSWSGFRAGLKGAAGELKSQLGFMVKQTSQSFAEMTYSSNGFVRAIGSMGSFIMANPIVAAIAAIVAIMVILYNTSDEFRKFVDGAFKTVMDMLTSAWNDIQKALQPAIDAFGELMKTLGIDNGKADSPLVFVMEAIINVIKGVLAVLIPIVTYIISSVVPAITRFISIFNGVIEIVKGVISWIAAFFKALVTGKWDEFAKASDKAWKSIKKGALDILAGIVNFFIDSINNIIRLANGIAGNIKKATGGVISLGVIPELPRWVPKLALGGTVMPSNGGSLVNVAEAGKPERIEPLDANGLSNRDKAMIDYLSKNSGMAGKSIQLNVYPSPGMDERELAAVVSRQLAFELRKGGI